MIHSLAICCAISSPFRRFAAIAMWVVHVNNRYIDSRARCLPRNRGAISCHCALILQWLPHLPCQCLLCLLSTLIARRSAVRLQSRSRAPSYFVLGSSALSSPLQLTTWPNHANVCNQPTATSLLSLHSSQSSGEQKEGEKSPIYTKVTLSATSLLSKYLWYVVVYTVLALKFNFNHFKILQNHHNLRFANGNFDSLYHMWRLATAICPSSLHFLLWRHRK